jgi:hypothetical protein
MLNLNTWVTPNHFDVADFQPFSALTPDAEFDLVAPVLVYFRADMRFKPQARAALKKLKALKHPLVSDQTLADLLETAPMGLDNRYNALVMHIVKSVAADAKPYIDEYGAFGFHHGDDSCVLMGDASGFFGFHMCAETVRQRFA